MDARRVPARHASTGRRLAYWGLSAALLAFGTLTILSIGFPLFVLGLELAVLWPVRHRKALLWSVLGATVAFFVAYLLVAPLSCSELSKLSGPGATVCTNVLGIRYEGPGVYEPPLW